MGQVMGGRAPLTIPYLLLSPVPNLTLLPYAQNPLALVYRRDVLPSRTSLNEANFGIIAALSAVLLLLHGARKMEARLRRRPLLLDWMTVVGLSLLESFLSATFTAPVVPRPAIHDEASLYRLFSLKHCLLHCQSLLDLSCRASRSQLCSSRLLF